MTNGCPQPAQVLRAPLKKFGEMIVMDILTNSAASKERRRESMKAPVLESGRSRGCDIHRDERRRVPATWLSPVTQDGGSKLVLAVFVFGRRGEVCGLLHTAAEFSCAKPGRARPRAEAR